MGESETKEKERKFIKETREAPSPEEPEPETPEPAEE